MSRDYDYCIYQKKTRGGYETTWETGDSEKIYKDLAKELIKKKLEGAEYIKSIKRRQQYNGYVEITVNYADGYGRRIYTVESH